MGHACSLGRSAWEVVEYGEGTQHIVLGSLDFWWQKNNSNQFRQNREHLGSHSQEYTACSDFVAAWATQSRQGVAPISPFDSFVLALFQAENLRVSATKAMSSPTLPTSSLAKL